MKNITISIDDGHPLDCTVANMLAKHGLKATFYWSKTNPKYEVMNEDDMRLFRKTFPQMEIGQHGYNHTVLTKVPLDEAKQDILSGREWHQSLWKEWPKMFCYPRGYYNEYLAGFLEGLDYKGARSVVSKRVLPLHPEYEMDGGFHVYEGELVPRGLKALRLEDENVSIWLHSWEINKFGDWQFLEEVLEKVSSYKPLSLTNYEYIKKGCHLK